MKHLTLEDMERLSREICAISDDVSDWAERVGLDSELLDKLGNVACNQAHDLTVEMAKRAFMEGKMESQVTDEDGEEHPAVEMNIGDIIKSACISMFALGFETHKQFGGADAGEE